MATFQLDQLEKLSLSNAGRHLILIDLETPPQTRSERPHSQHVYNLLSLNIGIVGSNPIMEEWMYFCAYEVLGTADAPSNKS